MAIKPIPEGYHTITPFLVTPKVKECMEFLKKAFDAQELYKMEASDGAIMHAEMKIGNSMLMMGEASEKYPPLYGALYLYVEDVDKITNRQSMPGLHLQWNQRISSMGTELQGLKISSVIPGGSGLTLKMCRLKN